MKATKITLALVLATGIVFAAKPAITDTLIQKILAVPMKEVGAKVFGKAHEFSRRQILIAEKQHLMSEPELTELLKHGDVIQRRAQIEPDDFRANGASDFLALNHGWGLPFNLRPKPRFDTTQVLALM